MSFLKIEILLPLYYNKSDNSKKQARIEGIKYVETYDEIFDRFSGCTIDNSPLIGGWLNPKTRKEIKEDNIAYSVVCKSTKSNIRFFTKLRATLKKRFKQEDIMMYYIKIQMI